MEPWEMSHLPSCLPRCFFPHPLARCLRHGLPGGVTCAAFAARADGDGRPPSPLFFPFLLHSSPPGCVAYGMGCVAVSHAPPPQPGPMAMAAPSSSSFISLFFLSDMLHGSFNHTVP